MLPVLLRLTSLVLGLALLAELCWVLIVAIVVAVRARRRQRELLALLGRGDPKAPGALVVDHPAAAAYCLPGLRSRIVVSVGALDLLRPAELAAVLAHERAHLRERHDLVVLPFTALRRAFGWSQICADAHQSVALLIEMLADDRALRARPARGPGRRAGPVRHGRLRGRGQRPGRRPGRVRRRPRRRNDGPGDPDHDPDTARRPRSCGSGSAVPPPLSSWCRWRCSSCRTRCGYARADPITIFLMRSPVTRVRTDRSGRYRS